MRGSLPLKRFARSFNRERALAATFKKIFYVKRENESESERYCLIFMCVQDLICLDDVCKLNIYM